MEPTYDLRPTTPLVSWRDWCVPLDAENLSLQQALDSLATVGARPEEVPLIVRLLENPAYHFPGLSLFPGAVGLEHHDAIHTLLGRGLLKRDEAFVIGFTMGSTRAVGAWQRHLFCWIASHLYPWAYKLRPEDVWVFHGAVKLAEQSGCKRLDTFNFDLCRQASIGDLRQHLGISVQNLQRFYRAEIRQFPGTPESIRLQNMASTKDSTDSSHTRPSWHTQTH